MPIVAALTRRVCVRLASGLLACLSLAITPPLLAQDLAQQTAQVEDLQSIREIKRLQAQWSQLALAADWQGMAALVTPDVVLSLPGGDLTGQAEAAGWWRQDQGGGEAVGEGPLRGRLNLQLLISPVVTLSSDGASATARWRRIALTGRAGHSADWHGSVEVISYRKTGDGWRIARMQTYPTFSGSYADGWRHDAATLQSAPIAFTPDQVGRILPDRRAASPRTAGQIEQAASLLLAQGEAQNLVNAYGYYLDRAMYDDVADLFVPGARVDLAGRGSYAGRAGVLRFLGRYGQDGLEQGELGDHLQLMPLVSLAQDGSRALIRTVELGMVGQHGGAAEWSAAINTFVLTRAADNTGGGGWRIAMLQHHPLLRAEYAKGWGEPGSAYLPVPESLFPDAPSSLSTIAYPDNPFALPPLGAQLLVPAPRGATGPPPAIAPAASALARAEAFDAAENVVNAYGEYINAFDWTAMAGVFATDGWRELPFIGIVKGRDEILAGARIRYGDNGAGPRREFQAIHMLAQPYVTVSAAGDRAQLRSRLLQFNSSASGPGSMIAGVYEKQLIKQGGLWRIAGMDLDYTWMAPYLGGWAKADPAAANALRPSPELMARYTLAAPIRGDAGIPFPAVPPLGFHYRNPVTGRSPERLLPWTDIPAKEAP